MMKLFIGLGNKGEKYRLTRHNIGFMIVDEFLKGYNDIKVTKKNNYHLFEIRDYNNKFLFMKPMTFMNNSGIAVRDYIRYNKISENDIFVIADDINLSFATVRIRIKGGAGGHNGLKSIINCLGTNDFARLRIGVGLPQDREFDVSNYVLDSFSKKEREKISSLYTVTNGIIQGLMTGDDLNKIMNNYNNIVVE